MFSYLKQHGRLFSFIVLLLFSICSSYLIIHATAGKKYNFDKQLVVLAAQFLRLHTAIPPLDVSFGDTVDYYHTFYLYFGPFPSMALMPFVLFFGKSFPQLAVGIVSIIISFVAVYATSKKFMFGTIDALWLALFFVFSSVLFAVGIINISAYQVQVMGVMLILLSLWAYFAKKSPLIVGTFLGMAILTRFTLGLSLVFFGMEYLYKRLSAKQLALLMIPVLFSCIVLGLYNFRRFHSLFETGYKYNTTLQSYPISANLKSGFLSVEHIPANLYSFLIMPPDPLLKDGGGFVLKFPYIKANPWGMAIWYTSPLFLVLLYKRKKNKYTVSALATSIILAIPSFLYFGIGYSQYGYRYALDFLPFLFLLLIPSLLPKLSKKDLILISIGVIFNCIYITSLWEIYPFFGIYK